MKGKLRLHLLKAWLKGGLRDKWRVAFLAFAAVYAVFLLLDITKMSIQWDEVTHLNGGSLLLHGQFQLYMGWSAFYPPMFDAVTTVFFNVFGVSVFAGRLVSITFSLLSLWAVFELAYRMYGPKIALVSSILLGIMPGYFWLSRMALVETMLLFFFTVSLLFFFSWLRTRQNKMLVFSGLALGLGFLTKYQMLIAGVIMLASLLLLSREYLKTKLKRFPLLIVTVVLVALPWFFISYQIYASGMLDRWIYALEIGNPEKLLYSTDFSRLPLIGQLPSFLQLPLFYLVEMTWPYSDVHPISLFLYVLGLVGLGLFAWRRKTEDKFLLTWFFVVYIFLTLISNKQWRYMIPIFPILALSSASLITSALCKAWKVLSFQQLTLKARKVLSSRQLTLSRKCAVQVAAGALILFTLVGLIAFTLMGAYFSVSDAHSWVAKDQIQVPVEEATDYAAARLAPNESIMVMCAQNLFSQDMVRFYLYRDGTKHNDVWQYPELPVDTYTPVFEIDEFVSLCEQHNVKYVFTYEFGGTAPYFNTTLNLHEVYMMLSSSGRFGGFPLPNNATFGINPRRIFILTFLG